MAHSTWRLAPAAMVLLGSLALSPSALAHGDDETGEGYLLVQQALAHLAHDRSAEGVALAMEKVDDALAATDQEGVDVGEVEAGMRALESGRIAAAQELLQSSITEAVAHRPPATGYQTGTSVVLPELDGRGGLRAGSLVALAGAVVVGGSGVWLSVRFRPRESVAALRRRLDGAGRPPSPDAPRTRGSGR